MTLDCQPVRLAGEKGKAALVFRQGELLAVLLELSAQYEKLAGGWYLEAGFGPLADLDSPSFANFEDAMTWVRKNGAAESSQLRE